MQDKIEVEKILKLENNVPIIKIWIDVDTKELKLGGSGSLVKFALDTYGEATPHIVAVRLSTDTALYIQPNCKKIYRVDICHGSNDIKYRTYDDRFRYAELSEFDNETNTCLLTLT